MANLSWQDIVNSINSAPARNGHEEDSGTRQWANVPGYGDVSINWGQNDNQPLSVNASIPGDKIYGRVLSPGENGGIKEEKAKYGTGWLDTVAPSTLAALAAAAIGGGMMTGWGGLGAGAGAGEASALGGLEGLGGLTGPMDLSGIAGTGLEGAYGLPEVSALGGGEYANEAAKFLQQQGLADSGQSLINTALPTADMGASEYANEMDKFLRQQAAADNGQSLINTSLPTVDLGDASLSSSDLMKKFLTPQNLMKVAGALTGKSGSTSGSGGGSGGFGGGSSTMIGASPNEISNMNPTVTAGSAAAPQQAQSSNQYQLQNSAQPTFNYGGYVPTQSVQNPAMAKLAKALQNTQEG